ncbi:Panacea domain-containing protein [Candidatus Electrothrix sp.]|uniref:Panacea domain-containing protein n=1 Tax=Candidatus Electrothrix sp. TaxID=2170559 RepID=UPI0040566B5D
MHALDLAHFIITTYPDKGITPMKLQKLAYYAKSWTLVAKHSFIQADFEKWTYGPVNTLIYNAYKQHGADVIPSGKTTLSISHKQKELLTFILDNYIDYSAFTLSAMTHNEAPWLEAEDNAVISDAAIISYYSNQAFAKNFIKLQNADQQPFHVLKSNSWHSFTLDMDAEEAETFAIYPTAEDYQHQSQKANHDFQKLLREIDELL